MRKVSFVPVTLLAAVIMSGLFARPTTLGAGEEADLDQMISSAKTAADHEAIAAVYERQAAAANAEAAKHVEMGAAYKKLGGALIGKQHIETHCDALIKFYKDIAKEDEALANAHRAMAKEAK